MTHNFDFFRTIKSRFVPYSHCLMASKYEGGVTLVKATDILNPFANDWKNNFFTDNRKKIASIPFLRNLVEMTTGEDWRYQKLTTMLHWKDGSETTTVGELDDVYNAICQPNSSSPNKSQLIVDLISQEAEACLGAKAGLSLDVKIVLAIAIRVAAERYMIARLADPDFVRKIEANQTQALIGKFRDQFPEDAKALTTLDRVSLMTPENIHVNSFMYEPIIDMSDDHLRKLYTEVVALDGTNHS